MYSTGTLIGLPGVRRSAIEFDRIGDRGVAASRDEGGLSECVLSPTGRCDGGDGNSVSSESATTFAHGLGGGGGGLGPRGLVRPLVKPWARGDQAGGSGGTRLRCEGWSEIDEAVSELDNAESCRSWAGRRGTELGDGGGGGRRVGWVGGRDLLMGGVSPLLEGRG